MCKLLLQLCALDHLHLPLKAPLLLLVGWHGREFVCPGVILASAMCETIVCQPQFFLTTAHIHAMLIKLTLVLMF